MNFIKDDNKQSRQKNWGLSPISEISNDEMRALYIKIGIHYNGHGEKPWTYGKPLQRCSETIIQSLDGLAFVSRNLKGRLDSYTVEEVRETFLGWEKDISFDLKDLTYISSAGLSFFLRIHKQLDQSGHKMTIIFHDQVNRILTR